MSALAVTLEQAKVYLRIDGDEEDALIASFMQTATELCEGILRINLDELEGIPKSVDQAVLLSLLTSMSTGKILIWTLWWPWLRDSFPVSIGKLVMAWVLESFGIELKS